MKIGDIIKSMRLSKHIAQKNLYENYCSRKEISRIENNKVHPSMELLIHISEILDVSMDKIKDLWLDNTFIYSLYSVMEAQLYIGNFTYFCKVFITQKKKIEINHLSSKSYIKYLYFYAVYYYIEKNDSETCIELILLAYEESKTNYFHNTGICLYALAKLIQNEIDSFFYNELIKKCYNFEIIEKKFIYSVLLINSISKKDTEYINRLLAEYNKVLNKYNLKDLYFYNTISLRNEFLKGVDVSNDIKMLKKGLELLQVDNDLLNDLCCDILSDSTIIDNYIKLLFTTKFI